MTFTYLQYLCDDERKQDPNVTTCTVALTVADTNGTVGPALLKAPPVDLFGVKRKVLAYQPRPPLVICSRCARLGHTATGCNASPRCIHCAAAHLTRNHRRLCGACRTEAVTAKDCPHPPLCANCGEEHRADSKTCRQARKYAAPKAPLTRRGCSKQAAPPPTDSEEELTDLEDSSLRYSTFAGFYPPTGPREEPVAGPSRTVTFADILNDRDRREVDRLRERTTTPPPSEPSRDHTMASPESEL